MSNEQREPRRKEPKQVGLSAVERILSFGLVVLLVLPSMVRAEDDSEDPEELLPPVGDRVILWHREQAPPRISFRLKDAFAAGVVGTYVLGSTVGLAAGTLVLCSALLDDGYRRSPASHGLLLKRGIEGYEPFSFNARVGYGRTTVTGAARAHRMEYSVALRHRQEDRLSLEYSRKSPATTLELRGVKDKGSFYLDLDVRFREHTSLAPPFDGSPRAPLRVRAEFFDVFEFLGARHRMSLARTESGRVVVVGQPRPISFRRLRYPVVGAYAERDWYHPGETVYGLELGKISFDGCRSIDQSHRVSLCLRTVGSFLFGPADPISPDEDARALGRTSYTGWWNLRAMAVPFLDVDLAVVRLRLEGEGGWISASPRLRLGEETRIRAKSTRSDYVLRLGADVQVLRSLGIELGMEAGRSKGRLSIYELDSDRNRGDQLHDQRRSVGRLAGFVRFSTPR